MDFINFIGLLIVFLFIHSISSRLRRLEKKGLKTDEDRSVGKISYSENQEISLKPVIEYIQGQLEKGVEREDVNKILLSKGWTMRQLDRAYEMVRISSSGSTEAHDEFMKVDEEGDYMERLVEWIKEDWILKLGAMLLIIGFGWFTTYAFVNNWIGPMGRISIGLILGASFMILGWHRIKKYIVQGGVFLIIGSTTVLLTTFAARAVYGFFNPFSALIIMFLSTAFVALVSVKYERRPLSYASLILAGIAPLLAKFSQADQVWIFAYLFFVTLGAIWIVFLTGRKALTLISLAIVFLYSLPYLNITTMYSANIDIILLFVYIFTALFFLTNTVGILKSKDMNYTLDLISAAGTGLFLLAWVMFGAQEEWRSLIIVSWMMVFSVGAFMVFRATNRKEPFYIYAGIGIAMLAAATSAELSGATLTIAYTIESTIIAMLAYVFFKDLKIAGKLSLLLIVPALLSFGSMVSVKWHLGVFHRDFFVLLILSAVLFVLGLFFNFSARNEEDEEVQSFGNILVIAGSVYIYILIWLSMHAALLDDYIAAMFSLVIYTVVGLTCYLYAVSYEKKGLKLYGGLMVGFVVSRLLLVDLWNMELIGRTITFFLIGTLLISTAFFDKYKKII